MKVIGITGGIGSGKSLVAKILIDQYNAIFLDTDRIAKEQMEIGGASYLGVVDYFGQGILSADGSIDRKSLADIVFLDKEKLQKLNALTHPQVLSAVKEEIEAWRCRGTASCLVIETALMIESGFDYLCDEVWYVYTPQELRRERLKKDRNYTDDKIDAIFNSQSKDEDFLKQFSIVIENTGEMDWLKEQVRRYYSTLRLNSNK